MIVIVDIGISNIGSVKNALDFLKSKIKLQEKIRKLKSAENYFPW